MLDDVSDLESAAVDYLRTALRPGWETLRAPVRAAVRDAVGSVVDVVMAGSGFTPAFAGTVTTATGDRFFVKAADLATEFGTAIEREAAVLAALPTDLPVPTLRWTTTVTGWSMLCLDFVDGHMPGQPWTDNDLRTVLHAQAVLADRLAIPTPDLLAAAAGSPFAEVAERDFDTWRRVHAGVETMPNSPLWLADHHEELAALEALLPAASADAAGIMHYDLRPDNILIRTGGAAVVLDWNWARPGPAWVDTVMLLRTAADDHDVDDLLTRHPSTHGIDAEWLDAVLAAVGGALVRASGREPVAASPFLRTHQRRQGLGALSWLARRRGWTHG